MNISSIILKISSAKIDGIKDALRQIEGAEIGLISPNNDIIILSLQSESLGEELKIFKILESIDGVISANMHYSYVEDEINNDFVALQDFTFDENAIDFIYSGDVNKKLDSIIKK